MKFPPDVCKSGDLNDLMHRRAENEKFLVLQLDLLVMRPAESKLLPPPRPVLLTEASHH